MTENDTSTLDSFLATYGTPETIVADIDLANFNVDDGNSPMIVVRFGNKAVVINPMAVSDYIDIDVHPFVDGKEASAAVLGFSPENRFVGFTPEDTLLRSNELPAVGLVAVVVGKQSKEVQV
jgi:hypothetical protein